jgi:predicted secreted protein
MGIALTLAIYGIVWWLTLFLVLPFGVKTQQEAGEVDEGTAPSAPLRPQIWQKMAITTVLSAAIFASIYWTIVLTGITLDDIPLFPKFGENY